MHDEELMYDPKLAVPGRGSALRARLVLITTLFSALLAAGMCVGAILAHAPVFALPLVVVICVGCPMFAAAELPGAFAALRADSAQKALDRLRRSLAKLPEIEHPLDR